MNTQLNKSWIRVRILKFVLLMLAIFSVVACSATTDISATPTSLPPPTTSPTSIPPTVTPKPTPTLAPLAPAQIFRKISPSIAFIETPLGYGSGMLLENGYILTNAHVIWPFQEARIVFSDGTEYEAVPLVDTDLMRDLVILGPIETDLPPLELEDGEGWGSGSTVYLVGFPGEVEEFPQPTITLGIISRVREWVTQDVTYIQTDATISGGQSGGVLVSDFGDVIGISGYAFAQGDFGLVASAADISSSVERMLAGDESDVLAERWIDLGKPTENSNRTFHSPWSSTIYYFQEPPETEVEIMVEGEADLILLLIDALGNIIDVIDNTNAYGEVYTFSTELEAPYFVLVYSSSTQNIWPNSNVNLHRIDEIDEGKMVQVGQVIQSTIDVPWENDYYRIFLHKNEVVHITVDSSMIDPHVTVRQFLNEAEEQWVLDDDSGNGVFGTNAELAYKAPAIGEYIIIVEDAGVSRIGGYTLSILEPTELSPTPMAPMPTAMPIDTAFGEMTGFVDKDLGINFEYPATMEQGGFRFIPEFGEFCLEVNYCFSDEQALLVVAAEDLTILGDVTLDEYAAFIIDSIEPNGYVEFEDQAYIETKAGTGIILSVNIMDVIKTKRLVFIHEGMGFGITYMYTNPYPGEASPIASDDKLRWLLTQRDIEGIISYSFSTVGVAP